MRIVKLFLFFKSWKNGKFFDISLGKTAKNILVLPWKNGNDMLKRKIDKYIENFYKNNRNALLVTGARQIGKTFSIREFGKKFTSFIEINFIENPDAVDLFKNAKSSEDILLRISTITNKDLLKGKTLIFFDEVQRCPDIVTAIKFLVDDGSYRYILSGSLLGVELKDLRSEPVGYLEIKEMFPLDFALVNLLKD